VVGLGDVGWRRPLACIRLFLPDHVDAVICCLAGSSLVFWRNGNSLGKLLLNMVHFGVGVVVATSQIRGERVGESEGGCSSLLCRWHSTRYLHHGDRLKRASEYLGSLSSSFLVLLSDMDAVGEIIKQPSVRQNATSVSWSLGSLPARRRHEAG
jgi:hypothetical protein